MTRLILTDRQREAFAVIAESIERTGLCPSMVELGAKLGVTDRCAAYDVQVLHRAGLLKRLPRSRHAWALTSRGQTRRRVQRAIGGGA